MIRQIRGDLSQETFGRSIGLTGSRITQLERDASTKIGWDPLERLCRLYKPKMRDLGLTMEDVLRGRRARRGERAA